jgi:hypothetical protein
LLSKGLSIVFKWGHPWHFGEMSRVCPNLPSTNLNNDKLNPN